GQRSQSPRRDDIDVSNMAGHRFDTLRMHENLVDAERGKRSPQESGLFPVAFNQMDGAAFPQQDRHDSARKAAARAEIHPFRRIACQRDESRTVDYMALPEFRKRRGRHQIDRAVPFPEMRLEGLEPVEGFT